MKTIPSVLMALFAMLIMDVGTLSGQEYVSTREDKALAESVLRDLKASRDSLPVPDLMVMAAKRLLGTPYVGGTLDDDPSEEKLRIFLTKTDCILFVETCLDLALTVRRASLGEPSFNDFASNVAKSRYRTGPPYSYGDRIHYTTEWIRRLEGSVLKDVTLELGGEVNDHPVNYMSTHPGSYKQLSDYEDIPRAALDLETIMEVERELNDAPMTYIPKSRVASASRGIKTGDIICFVPTIEGLDISHVAIAYVENGRVGFIHASVKEGKVVIDSQTIEQYVTGRRSLSGIKVVRPL